MSLKNPGIIFPNFGKGNLFLLPLPPASPLPSPPLLLLSQFPLADKFYFGRRCLNQCFNKVGQSHAGTSMSELLLFIH